MSQNKTRVLLCKRLSGECRDVYSIHGGILSPVLVVVGCIGLHCAVLGCIELYWAEQVCIGLHWAVLGCTWLFWNLVDCIWQHWAVLD